MYVRTFPLSTILIVWHVFFHSQRGINIDIPSFCLVVGVNFKVSDDYRRYRTTTFSIFLERMNDLNEKFNANQANVDDFNNHLWIMWELTGYAQCL